MSTISINEVMGQLPVQELEASMATFLAPMMAQLPDRRLQRVVPLAVRGILGSESPVVSRAQGAPAQVVARTESAVWPAAKRIYGLLQNERFRHTDLGRGLYAISRANVVRDQLDYLVVAIDPMNLEKPYTEQLEGVSTVHKSTPPDRHGQARLTTGYPCITALVVNSRIPATTYANWFSYTTDFVSENMEIQRALEATRPMGTRLFPDHPLRYVLDAGFDDRRWFAALREQEFVVRASHLERKVEVYNNRLDRWEAEVLGDLVAVVPFSHTLGVTFRVPSGRARQTRLATMQTGWFPIRLPDTHQPLWVIVAYEAQPDRTLVLLTNVPLHAIQQVGAVYHDWRLRARIEHAGALWARFDQEQGLDVEDMRVQKLEHMKRLFLLVLAAVQFIFYLIHTWPPPAVLWIRTLGGKLHLKQDLDGPYLVLRGLAALLKTVATLSHAAFQPFPHFLFPPKATYG